ncbi:MAG: heavy-metal-associated domain-containing protein [Aristaeellaceae bacterium]
MTDFIVLAILAFLIALGVRASVKHFRHQGGCCGGGSYRARKKRLPQVKYRKHFSVSGMHCEHCKSRVEEAVNDIPGVAARVHLAKGEMTVLYAEPVDDEVIRQKLQRLGYTADVLPEHP